jgi:hypothetical protein
VARARRKAGASGAPAQTEHDSSEWLDAHREELVGATELVFAAVQLARMERRLETRDQRRYAVTLSLATLRELGAHGAPVATFVNVEQLTGWLVLATWRIFEKRADRQPERVSGGGDTGQAAEGDTNDGDSEQVRAAA